MDTYACSSPTSRCDTFPSVDNPTDYRVAPGRRDAPTTTGLLNETRARSPARAASPGRLKPVSAQLLRVLAGSRRRSGDPGQRDEAPELSAVSVPGQIAGDADRHVRLAEPAVRERLGQPAAEGLGAGAA